ncbi:MAG TPA: hypothetical protein G4O12_09225 [Dehalococcoidia bacterium]|nr:hypothetical protein [Dehalococcoidia bacterium]
MATQIKKVKETKLLAARELAEKAGVSTAVITKLLRKEFNRAGKTLVEGNRSGYRFNLNEDVPKQIIARAKTFKKQPKDVHTLTEILPEQVNEPIIEAKSNGD